MISSWELSSLTIGIIIISTIAGIAIISLLFIFLKIRKKRENCDIEQQKKIKTIITNTTASMTNSSSNHHQRHPSSSAPITSSLDSHDIFSSLLEYPPSVIPPTSNNNSIHNIENDPISLSLARQSMEERAGYYRNPSRNPVPYYNHSTHSSSSSNNRLVIREEEEDEDLKVIQRWSQSSYHVW